MSNVDSYSFNAGGACHHVRITASGVRRRVCCVECWVLSAIATTGRDELLMAIQRKGRNGAGKPSEIVLPAVWLLDVRVRPLAYNLALGPFVHVVFAFSNNAKASRINASLATTFLSYWFYIWIFSFSRSLSYLLNTFCNFCARHFFQFYLWQSVVVLFSALLLFNNLLLSYQHN